MYRTHSFVQLLWNVPTSADWIVLLYSNLKLGYRIKLTSKFSVFSCHSKPPKYPR